MGAVCPQTPEDIAGTMINDPRYRITAFKRLLAWFSAMRFLSVTSGNEETVLVVWGKEIALHFLKEKITTASNRSDSVEKYYIMAEISKWLNALKEDPTPEYISLKEKVDYYFAHTNYWLKTSGSVMEHPLFLLVLAPVHIVVGLPLFIVLIPVLIPLFLYHKKKQLNFIISYKKLFAKTHKNPFSASQIKEIEQDNHELKKGKTRLEGENQTLIDELKKACDTFDKLQTEMERLKKQNHKLKKDKDRLEKENQTLDKLQAEIVRLKKQNMDLQTQLRQQQPGGAPATKYHKIKASFEKFYRPENRQTDSKLSREYQALVWKHFWPEFQIAEDKAYTRMKVKFQSFYHPDKEGTGSGFSKPDEAREEILKDFWPEFTQIDDQK